MAGGRSHEGQGRKKGWKSRQEPGPERLWKLCKEAPEGNGKSIKDFQQGCDKVSTVLYWKQRTRLGNLETRRK